MRDPTDAQVSAYYQAHQGQIDQPFDEIKDKIRLALKDQDIQKARVVYFQGLMQKAVNDGTLVVLMSPPPMTEMTADPSRLRGDPKAPVTIVVSPILVVPSAARLNPRSTNCWRNIKER